MLRRIISAFTIFLTAGLLLSACQTTKHVATTAEEAASQIAGDWEGDFINSRGTHYPLSFHIKNTNSQLSGYADIPSSSHDTRPSVKGTVRGNKVDWKTSSNFVYDLHMSKDAEGRYHLSGPVSGPNHGRLEIRKVN